RLSHSAGATPFMTLLAGFEALLYRYTGQEQMLIGAPIANRTRGETEGLIGFFVNTLVVRGDLSGDPTFNELIARVRETALGGYAHQDVPFDKLVEELQPERGLNRMPLFQVVFSLQNAPAEELKLPELELSMIDLGQATAKFDIVMNLRETGDEVSGSIEYNTDLFDAATIEKMSRHYLKILESAVAAPETRVSQLEMLTEEDRRIFEQKVQVKELEQSFSF
ncbi:MAG TPA: condensation domain-containing protein, partial [Pyrinomonadaceae bacterium]|nr:condensation domain-containing protein [Pyrinomonadaceae bacterium]